MTSDRTDRRLAAIMALDVVAYSKMMAADETGTLQSLNDLHKNLVAPSVAGHNGRIVKLMGDGALVEFVSAVDAVDCAMTIQSGMSERNHGKPADTSIQLRVGINLGDIIVANSDIYGDGVNIAARLEALCDPGSIYISGTVFEHVRGKVDCAFQDLGRKQVKNISEPVHVYGVTARGDKSTPELRDELSEMPSIAVLALDDLSGGREQELFCDAVSEDVTTALSRFDWLFVAARNAAFQFKGQATDMRRIGQQLGVRYLLEGSVRQIGTQLRVNVQLIETDRQGHVWAERVDHQMEDLFAAQDDIVARIASTVAPEILQTETGRAKAKDPDSLGAWDHYLLARAGYYDMTRLSIQQAFVHLEKAVELSPEFADSHALMGLCLAQSAGHGWERPAREVYLRAHAATEKAVRMAPHSPEANHALAWVLMVTNRAREAVTVARRSIELNPHYADAYAVLGHSLIMCGELESGLDACRKAQRSNPRDPRGSWLLDAMGHAYFFLGDYDRAIELSAKGLHQDPSLYGALVTLACSNARLGRHEEARGYIERLQMDIPRFTLSAVRKNPMFVDPDLVENLVESLRQAGLPD